MPIRFHEFSRVERKTSIFWNHFHNFILVPPNPITRLMFNIKQTGKETFRITAQYVRVEASPFFDRTPGVSKVHSLFYRLQKPKWARC